MSTALLTEKVKRVCVTSVKLTTPVKGLTLSCEKPIRINSFGWGHGSGKFLMGGVCWVESSGICWVENNGLFSLTRVNNVNGPNGE